MSCVEEDTFVIARDSGFWHTEIFRRTFPRHFLLPARPSKLQYVVYIVLSVFCILFARPMVLLLGTSTKLPVVFGWLRSKGVLKDMKIITDNQHLREHDVTHVDTIIVYSPEEVNLFEQEDRDKVVPVHWPSKLELVDVSISNGDYIFSAGNHRRDHVSFIQAMESVDMQAIVVTSNVVDVTLPNNVILKDQMPLDEYLQYMADARFVVVPLTGGTDIPHGHCDISTALSMGKIVITTKGASADYYIQDGRNGFLVKAGNVSEYTRVITELLTDDELFSRMTSYTQKHKKDFLYEPYAEKLTSLCNNLLTR